MRTPRVALAALMAVYAAAFGAAPAIASPNAPTPSNDLVDKSKDLDGSAIVFEGEAIGEPMVRGDHAWINASDGTYGIGIWLPRSELAKVERFGSYSWQGDRIRVSGVFRRACPEHGGDLDIHADSIEVIGRGSAIAHRAGGAKIAAAVALLALGLLLLALWRRRERKPLPESRATDARTARGFMRH